MSEFMNDLKDKINKVEEMQFNCLTEHGGSSTDWSIRGNYRNPGFFTPFNQTHGFKQAVIGTGLWPALKVQSALSAALLFPATILAGLGIGTMGEFEPIEEGYKFVPALAIGAVYFSGAFVINLLKEITALITRSFATLLAMCTGYSVKPELPPELSYEDSGWMFQDSANQTNPDNIYDARGESQYGRRTPYTRYDDERPEIRYNRTMG